MPKAYLKNFIKQTNDVFTFLFIPIVMQAFQGAKNQLGRTIHRSFNFKHFI